MLDDPIVERRTWPTTIAPAYLGVFIWIPFLDALGRAGVGSSGAVFGALLAVLAGYGLLYAAPARLGWSSGQRLPVVASTALGTGGGEWIVGVLFGLFGLVWAALAISFSVQLVLMGLIALDLIGAADLGRSSVGGLSLESPLFLVCTLFWTLIIASANGLRLVGVISALLKVYASVAALLLILIAAWAASHPTQDAARAVGEPEPGLIAPRVFQVVFGYFAFAGLMGVEWGAAVRERRDLRFGGLLGIVAGGSAATIAALIVASSDPGAMGAGGIDRELSPGSFPAAVLRGFGATAGSRAAGVVLLLFGLAALAPACYGAAIFTSRFRTHWPWLRGWGGIGVFYAAILATAATGLAARTEAIFAISGALFAPAAGVLTAEAILSRGRWAGVREGWPVPGVASWAIGAVVGVAPMLGVAVGVPWLEAIQPASLYGYLTAATAYGASASRSPGGPAAAVARAESVGDDG